MDAHVDLAPERFAVGQPVTRTEDPLLLRGQGRYTDVVLGFPLEFGLGFGLSGPEGHYGPNPDAFGHDGFGGSAVGGDPEAGIALAYVMNRMGMNLVDDPRKMALVAAVYQSLGQA